MSNNSKNFGSFFQFHLKGGSNDGNEYLTLFGLSNSYFWNSDTKSLCVNAYSKAEINLIKDHISLVADTKEVRAVSASYVDEAGIVETIDENLLLIAPQIAEPEYTQSNLVVVNDKILSNVDTGIKSDQYQEVNDYSFLNVVAEEVIPLNVEGKTNIREIIYNSLNDINFNKDNLDKDLKFNIMLDNFSKSSHCKLLLHSIEETSYLQVMDADQSIYDLSLQQDGESSIDNDSLDIILDNIITHHNKSS